jgi:hypothetical protein
LPIILSYGRGVKEFILDNHAAWQNTPPALVALFLGGTRRIFGGTALRTVQNCLAGIVNDVKKTAVSILCFFKKIPCRSLLRFLMSVLGMGLRLSDWRKTGWIRAYQGERRRRALIEHFGTREW